jgi:RNA polymerase sigma-70 factor (ECF subfamily)
LPTCWETDSTASLTGHRDRPSPPGEAAGPAAPTGDQRQARTQARGRARARAGAASDAELVTRAQAGDAEAYGELVRRHRAAALRVAAAILGTAQGAEAPDDVVQAASERAWRAIDRIEAARAFRPWFLTIVANGARNDRRARGRRARLAERVAGTTAVEAGATPEEAAVRRDEHGQVARAFGRLAEGDRVVLALRHVERMSEREMATALDCAPGTVKSRLARATVRLRVQLAAVVAVALALALAVGLLAPVREAVAGWLGIGSTRIDQAPPIPADPGRDRPRVGEGLVPATRAEVEEELGATPADLGLATSDLGSPEVTALVPDGGVVLAWPDGGTTLWVRRRGDDGPPFIKRPTGAEPLTVLDVPGLGDQALVVEGDHVLDTPRRSLAAGAAVLWVDRGWEYRLEGALATDRLVAIARSFGPPR